MKRWQSFLRVAPRAAREDAPNSNTRARQHRVRHGLFDASFDFTENAPVASAVVNIHPDGTYSLKTSPLEAEHLAALIAALRDVVPQLEADQRAARTSNVVPMFRARRPGPR